MRTKFIGIVAAVFLAALPFASDAQVSIGVSVNVAPPPLPVYEQPEVPGPGYIWVPGYWSWSDEDGDYYWVPGTWVEPPEVGLLWTPGWWAWSDGGYLWHAGYWGPTVGFYGGINYGFGYTGRGYEGGYWRDRNFYYNRSVNNVTNVNITNVYNKTVIVNNTTVNRVSFNGGQEGVRAEPTAQQRAMEQARHVPPTSVQTQQRDLASRNRELRASVNQGKPAVAATARPGEFSRGVVAARAAGGPVHIAAQPRGQDARQGAAAQRSQAEQQSRAQADQRAQAEQRGQQQRGAAQQEQQRAQAEQQSRAQADQRAQAEQRGQQQRRDAQQEQR
ncbi:MAG TPA: hypothetical protein VFO23_10480, partial [Steroidobacteraceae bacterium]|nr:hypothetical protein [Steroidobacteraceae bacterium]